MCEGTERGARALEKTEDSLLQEAQKTTTRLVIDLSLRSMVRLTHTLFILGRPGSGYYGLELSNILKDVLGVVLECVDREQRWTLLTELRPTISLFKPLHSP